MGFMDKAKKMAEQAQQKVEEKQAQFNESQAQKAQSGAGAAPATTFDAHGRPVSPPAAGGPAPLATDPTAPLTGGDPAGAPPVGDTATAEPPAPVQTTEPTEDPALKPGVNKTPDPFKPIG